MGNTFSALRLRLARKASASTGLARGEGIVAIDRAEHDRAIVQLERSVGDLAQADRLADQRLAEEQLFAPPFDLAVGAHPPHKLGVGVVRLAQATAVGTRWRVIVLGRGGLAQRLVRSLLVEGGLERIETPLLRPQCRSRRVGGLLLEREMQALVAAVLLRLAGRDPLWHHAGLDQPD